MYSAALHYSYQVVTQVGDLRHSLTKLRYCMGAVPMSPRGLEVVAFKRIK